MSAQVQPTVEAGPGPLWLEMARKQLTVRRSLRCCEDCLHARHQLCIEPCNCRATNHRHE